ncbi:polyprenyl synthetase family protein [Natronospora cellulosivora (SeqCode)]
MDRFKKFRNNLNNYMLDHCHSRRNIINTAVEDLIMGGGKRLRPIMFFWASKFGQSEEKELLPIAAGIELLHMATLVHDDIIDEAILRRGEVTAQERFGKNVAVFVGDFLLTKANDLFSQNLSRHSLKRLNKTISLVCEGEIHQYEEKYILDVSINDYLRRIRRKTALLFAVSTYMGGYESGLRSKNLSLLYNFALELGMTFQIQDDLLDFVGQEEKTGKKMGQDLIAGIYTLPVIYLMQKKDFSAEARSILSKDLLDVGDVNIISQRVVESGALKDSKELGKKFLDRANNSLHQLPKIKAREDMMKILKRQLKRQK